MKSTSPEIIILKTVICKMEFLVASTKHKADISLILYIHILKSETHFDGKQIQRVYDIDEATRDDYGDPWNQQYSAILKIFHFLRVRLNITFQKTPHHVLAFRKFIHAYMYMYIFLLNDFLLLKREKE